MKDQSTLRLFLALALLLSASGALSEELKDAEASQSTPARAAEATAGQRPGESSAALPLTQAPSLSASPASSDKDEGTGGVFLPSEEISEDFAVSFPVDI